MLHDHRMRGDAPCDQSYNITVLCRRILKTMDTTTKNSVTPFEPTKAVMSELYLNSYLFYSWHRDRWSISIFLAIIIIRP